MTLTMTRTRTQTALTKLVQLVAEVHGEVATIEGLLSAHPEHRPVLEARAAALRTSRDALYKTLSQFDPALDPATIGETPEWLAPYGRRGAGVSIVRYLAALSEPPKVL